MNRLEFSEREREGEFSYRERGEEISERGKNYQQSTNSLNCLTVLFILAIVIPIALSSFLSCCCLWLYYKFTRNSEYVRGYTSASNNCSI